jgi:lipopolysaccharide export system protein LptA
MKRFCLIVMAAGGSLLSLAQTNMTGTLLTARGPTLISSESADFDLAGHEAIYRGHVRVDDPQMKLACEQLTADVPQAGGHVNHLVAETNVMIDFTDNKGQTNHATGDKAVYVYQEQGGVTNESITLTGNPQPQVENAHGLQAGDVIIWNRENTNSHIRISGNYHMILHPKPGDVVTDTNASPQNTNAAPAKTNPPPGTAENMDTPKQ